MALTSSLVGRPTATFMHILSAPTGGGDSSHTAGPNTSNYFCIFPLTTTSIMAAPLKLDPDLMLHTISGTSSLAF